MRKVKVAAVQMRCTRDVNANIANAEGLVRKAAADGAQIILLPELFERQYFCQERQYEYYEFAKPVEENDAVKHQGCAHTADMQRSRRARSKTNSYFSF